MLKRATAILGAFLIPYLLFVFVISLNESEQDKENAHDNQVNFNVEKQKKIKKHDKPKTERKRQRRIQQNLPSIKPSNIGNDIGGSGLSFGIPSFDESEFDDVADGGLLESDSAKAMDNSTVDTPPKVVKRSPIVYPESARRQGISGFVTMNVLVNENGSVEDVEILDSKPEEIFDLKAENTIRRWQFEPATYNGKKVKVWATQKIVFELN